MVRFIIAVRRRAYDLEQAFTFQYGQIYYIPEQKFQQIDYFIYIPIWLDLL